jgi:hypothetical protein
MADIPFVLPIIKYILRSSWDDIDQSINKLMNRIKLPLSEGERHPDRQPVPFPPPSPALKTARLIAPIPWPENRRIAHSIALFSFGNADSRPLYFLASGKWEIGHSSEKTIRNNVMTMYQDHQKHANPILTTTW